MDDDIDTTPRNTAFTPGYRRYMLGLLVGVFAFNFIDRNILSVLLPQIKAELELSDLQLGLIGGIAFALFYSTAGLPMARLADRVNRVNIIGLAIALWSVMTAVGGLATSFVYLMLSRVGVGIGEAGCTPPAHSILSDVYEPERRATALSIYSAGAPIGGFVGLLVGGWVAEWYGWRTAMMVVGLPGLLLALVVKLTLREPPRGLVEKRATEEPTPSVFGVIRLLGSRPTFRHLALGASLSAFAGYGNILWLPSYLHRSIGMGIGEIGTWLSFMGLIAGTTGMIAGGAISDRLARRNPAWWMWFPAASIVVGVPFGAAAFLLSSKWIVLACLTVPGLTANIYPGPTYSTVQGMVGLRMRAVAIAFILFFINLIGLGIGPFVVGALSDWFQTLFGNESLRYSLLIILTCFKSWSAVHFYLAGRTVAADLARAPE